MTKLYVAYGKQVKREGEHFADACDETAAQIIADALNGERASPGPGMLCYAPDYVPNDAASVAELCDPLHPQPVEQIVPDDPYSFTPVDPISFTRVRIGEMDQAEPSHTVTQRPDGDYQCTCGRGWDRDEGDECPGAAS